MKRGDYAALALFFVQAAAVFYRALYLPPNLPGLGEHYRQIPLLPLADALGSIRTLGYPAFHALMAHYGWGLESYPTFHMMVLIPCVFVFWWGLRAYGLTGLAALAAVSPLLWLTPVGLIMPETLAKCFAIASLGFLLWAAGTRRAVAYLGLAVSVFLAYQMRPAFLFLVGFLPVTWFFLYARRWGVLNQAKCVRNAVAAALACALPLFLFCLLRLAVVGHFGLVSFAGQNTAGIAIEMLSPEIIAQLPPEDRPLALLLERARTGWPADRFLNPRSGVADWNAAVTQYAANVNRIARTVQARFPDPKGGGNVQLDQSLNRMSLRVFGANPRRYAAWLCAATLEAARVTATLLLGGDYDFGLGVGERASLTLLALLALLSLCSWPLERRAFGEGSRPHFTRAVTVIAAVAALFLGCKMLLVILVEPPIARYVQAAAFLLPCAASALYWDRLVVLSAGLLRKPHWYGQCYAAYPPIPDLYRPLPWRNWIHRLRPGRRALAVVFTTLLIVSAALWWTTRDSRLFGALRHDYENARGRLLGETPPVAWRDRDGATPLHYAALRGDAPLVAHLVNAGAQPDAAARNSATPLHWASLGQGDAGTIGALLDAGAAPDAKGPLDLSPVHVAALAGNAAALDALLARGAGANQKTAGGVAPLHIAQSESVAEVLLAHGAEVDARDWSNATPLSWAHTRNLAAFLLAHGADINAKETWRTFVRDCTPLHKAAYQGDLDSAAWLLEQGADPNVGDINDLTPLFYAIWRNDAPLAKLLLAHGADVNHAGQWFAYHRDYAGDRFTGIYAKTLGRHPDREHIGEVVPDESPIRPLDWAAFLGRADMAELLMAAGADTMPLPQPGLTPKAWALLGSKHDLARQLPRLVAERAPMAAPPSAAATSVVEEAPATAPLAESAPAPTPASEEARRAGLRAALEVEARAYRAGEPNILEGNDGFLFTRQACAYMLETDFLYATPGDPASGPSPALASIRDIHRQLAGRGIHLIVLPAPMAVEVHTDAFYPDWNPQEASQPARAAFVGALRESGLDALDVLPNFQAYRAAHPGDSLYLKEDGHWNSTAIGIAAGAIAERIRAQREELQLDTTAYVLESVEQHAGLTRIAQRLSEDRQAPYRDAIWPVTRVLLPDGSPYLDDDASPVLVAGDSYTLIFNELAGHLSARLAAELGYPVASYHGLAAGPIIPRVLARKGKAYIDQRKVIVWVFSASYIRPQGKDQWGPLELP